MLIDERLVVCAVLNQQVRDAVSDGQVSAWLELYIVVGKVCRTRAPRRHVDDPDLIAFGATINHATEQDRVHLGRVVAPHDERVARIKIVVTTRRLIDAIG